MHKEEISILFYFISVLSIYKHIRKETGTYRLNIPYHITNESYSRNKVPAFPHAEATVLKMTGGVYTVKIGIYSWGDLEQKGGFRW